MHTFDDRAVSYLVLTVADRLQRMGHRVTLITVVQNQRTFVVPEGVAHVDLDVRHRTAVSVLKLTTVLRRLRADVLFAHMGGPSRTAILARALANAPTAIVNVEHCHYSSRGWDHRAYRDLVTRLVIPHAARVAGVSPAVVADLEKIAPGIRNKTVVLPSIAPDPERVQAALGRRPDHPWYSADRSEPVICSVGNLLPRKGQDVLVEALPGIRAQIGCGRIVFVGRFDNISFVDRLKSRAHELGVADHIWFAGFHRECLPFIAHADVFAHASVTEGLPMVILEAMASGVPVAAAECPSGPRYALDEGRCGALVPMNDPSAMAAAIAQILSDPRLRREYIRLARQRAQLFSPTRVAEAYENLAYTCRAERNAASNARL